MDYRVIISPAARADLQDIVTYIAQDDARVAANFGHRLLDQALALATHPFRGRPFDPTEAPGVRYVVLGVYLIFYECNESGEVIILRFWHGARGEPELA